ncbi:MAG: dipeptide epimerase [Polyangiaceae bacterium]
MTIVKAPPRVSAIECTPKELLLTETFGTAAGKQESARNAFVQVKLTDGTVGWGEAAPFQAINGESQEAVLAAFNKIVPLVLGANVAQFRAISKKVEAEQAWPIAARCALEQALLDAYTTYLGIPLWALFGGEGCELDTDMTITTGNVVHAKQSAEAIRDRGIKSFKIKVGAVSVDDDVERVRAAVEAAPQAQILLDGNAAYEAEVALDLLAKLRSHGVHVTLFEQPCKAGDLDGMARLVREADTIICADESAQTPADVLELVKRRAATAVNIKVMKSGVIRAWEMVTIARAAGLDLMIGGMVESIVSMNFSANFAYGLGGFRFVDLDTPFFMKDTPFSGGFTVNEGRISLAKKVAGAGVTYIEPPASPADPAAPAAN